MSREISKQVIVERLDWCVETLNNLRDLKPFIHIFNGLAINVRNGSMNEKDMEDFNLAIEYLHELYGKKLEDTIYSSENFLGEFVEDNKV